MNARLDFPKLALVPESLENHETAGLVASLYRRALMLTLRVSEAEESLGVESGMLWPSGVYQALAEQAEHKKRARLSKLRSQRGLIEALDLLSQLRSAPQKASAARVAGVLYRALTATNCSDPILLRRLATEVDAIVYRGFASNGWPIRP